MSNDLKAVWLVARREMKDQIRDWRVTLPMITLVIFFPFLMNFFSRQAVDFLNQYNTNFILQRLVPFSILIIGFFPLTVSLVMALESFVGEKERGSIEPLLSAPLEDWQLYFGKLLVGALTPLIASYISIAIYLLMVVWQERLELPPWDAVAQLLVLTAAHAFLMVSAAVAVSAQATSVKAANLLASFIVIPVAMLMQGETATLVWGDRASLWMIAGSVIILALLLIRLGLAHFQREYLLGREIDSLNLRRMWQIFARRFSGGARSLGEWYRLLLSEVARRLVPSLIIVVLIAAASIWAGYRWTKQNAMKSFADATPEKTVKAKERLARLFPELSEKSFTPASLFVNNARATLAIFFMGLISFSVAGMLAYVVNVALIGAVYAALEFLRDAPLPIFLAGVLPHGIFEIPALALTAAATLYFSVLLFTPQANKPMSDIVIEQIADWARLYLGLILPLLTIAALIEAYVTPALLALVLK